MPRSQWSATRGGHVISSPTKVTSYGATDDSSDKDVQPKAHYLIRLFHHHCDSHIILWLGGGRTNLWIRTKRDIRTMGSGNSTPVKQAQQVETEAHQDLIKLRFDHLALGGTVTLIIIASILLYLLCKRQRSRRPHRDRTPPREGRMPPPPPPAPAPPPQNMWPLAPFYMPPHPSAFNQPSWWQLELLMQSLRQLEHPCIQPAQNHVRSTEINAHLHPARNHDNRFTEINAKRTGPDTSNPVTSKPARPSLPSPGNPRRQTNPAWRAMILFSLTH